jgi:polyisoprenoid-binding protein YceI
MLNPKMIAVLVRLAANRLRIWAVLSVTVLAAATGATAQQKSLQLDPAHTSVRFTLGDVLHTVHGTFHLQRGALQLEPSSGKLTGEIVVDATSGETGSAMRDRKMHKEVLESDRYPEISFRPDRVEGAAAYPGQSSLKVHGTFRIHGVDREITVPAEAEISATNWTATVHFTIPYEKWGMKNPSNLFLRVEDSVQIDLAVSGSVVQQNAAVRDSPK